MGLNHLSKFRFAAASVAALGLSSAGANAAVEYNVLDLEVIGQALAVSNDGRVAGSYEESPGGPHDAFRSAPYSPVNPATDTIGAGSFPPNTFDMALAMNNGGQVVGTYNNWSQPFRSDAGGSYVDFGDRGFGGATATSINDAGQATGIVNTSAAGDARVFRTAPNGLITDAELFESLGAASAWGVDAINTTGQVVGQQGAEAFRTDPNGSTGFTLLGTTLMQPGGSTSWAQSSARGINDAGETVGFVQNADGSVKRAFISGANGEPVALTDLGEFGTYTQFTAEAISNQSVVVGYMTGGGNPQHGFIWDEANGLRDLNDLIDPASGAVILVGQAINENGEIAVNALFADGQHPALLTIVPEPGALSLLAIAAVPFLRRRR